MGIVLATATDHHQQGGLDARHNDHGWTPLFFFYSANSPTPRMRLAMVVQLLVFAFIGTSAHVQLLAPMPRNTADR